MPSINKINSFNSVNLLSALDKPYSPQRSSDFEELISRVSPEERSHIDEKLALIADNKDVKIQMLHEALESQNWDHEIFQDENYPYYALEAVGLEEGDKHKLSRGQFATLMSFWKTSQDFQVRSIPLFNTNGSINEEARKIIKQTLRLASQDPIYFLSDEQIEQFFEEMSKLPKSEQQFFIVPKIESKEVTALKVIYELGINIFAHFFEKSQEKRMIPSFGMMQAYLNVKYEQDAVEMMPFIGLSSIDDIRENGLKGERDFAIHFPGVSLPEKADDVQALGFDFSYHDFYHSLVASSAPRKFPPLFIQIADIIYRFKRQKTEILNNKIQNMYELFIDMEVTPFRHELRDDSSENDLFWEHIDSVFEDVRFRSAEELWLKMEIAELIAKELPLKHELLAGPREVLSKKMNEINAKIIEFFEENPSARTKHDYSQFPELVNYHYLKQTHPLKVITAIWEKRSSEASSHKKA